MKYYLGEKGLTLAEIMVSFAIIVIAGLPVIWVFINGTTGIIITKNYVTAVAFAREAIEACRAYSFTWLDADDLFVGGGSSGGLAEPYKSIKAQDGSITDAIFLSRFIETDFANDDGDDDRYWHTKTIRDVTFTRVVDIFPAQGINADIKPDCKVVTVTITWNEPKLGKDMSYTLTTALAKNRM